MTLEELQMHLLLFGYTDVTRKSHSQYYTIQSDNRNIPYMIVLYPKSRKGSVHFPDERGQGSLELIFWDLSFERILQILKEVTDEK